MNKAAYHMLDAMLTENPAHRSRILANLARRYPHSKRVLKLCVKHWPVSAPEPQFYVGEMDPRAFSVKLESRTVPPQLNGYTHHDAAIAQEGLPAWHPECPESE